MQDEKTSDANYQKGFNEGYLITKHLPELSDNLSKIKNETPRIEGFQDGRKQFVLEQTKEHLPSWMNLQKNKSAEQHKPKEDKEQDKQ